MSTAAQSHGRVGFLRRVGLGGCTSQTGASLWPELACWRVSPLNYVASTCLGLSGLKNNQGSLRKSCTCWRLLTGGCFQVTQPSLFSSNLARQEPGPDLPLCLFPTSREGHPATRWVCQSLFARAQRSRSCCGSGPARARA